MKLWTRRKCHPVRVEPGRRWVEAEASGRVERGPLLTLRQRVREGQERVLAVGEERYGMNL